MNKLFKINEKVDNYSPNYLACICRIEEIRPMEKADKLKMTTVNGHDIIISSDYSVGDIVVYFPCESSICEKYLSVNNLYESAEYERNSNKAEVAIFKKAADSFRAKGDNIGYDAAINEIRKRCGFFNKYGRVRLLKLRGEYSDGFIAGVNTIELMYPEITDWNWDEVIGTQFNELNGEIFCTKFIPPIKPNTDNHSDGQKKSKKIQRKFNRFDRIIPDMFKPHYDTLMLGENMKDNYRAIEPDDVVTVSVKVHGTSVIIANILCNRKLSWFEKIKKFLGFKVQTTEYGNVYSSRKVIKNQYINPSAEHFYKLDIWGCVNRDFSPYISKDMTVYGEIVGYIEGSDGMIQKQHDYGCNPGQWKFMPYRITTNLEDGKKFEWNLSEVNEWTNKLVAEHPELHDKVLPLTIVYHGKMKDMYPDIPETDEHWASKVVSRIKSDKDWLLMEQDEPLCRNKVPREGYVVKIDNDKYPRAWKVKSMRHYEFEGKLHDKGEADIEETGGE